MKILFVHNNFPAQFQHVARALSRDPNVTVAAIGSATSRNLANIKLLQYSVANPDVSAAHPFARRFEFECRRAEEVLYAASSLVYSGFAPDTIVAHPGWGESLPLRSIFPKARIIAYCEFYYGLGRDVGFDPEFPQPGIDGHVALHLKNAASLLALCECDQGVSPTAWQYSTYPKEFQDKIKIIHEGVDVDIAKPKPDASLRLPDGTTLTRSDEVVTFIARNLEPLRGYHIFMRAVPKVLAKRPRAHIVILGGDGMSYGTEPPAGRSWKSIFFDEIGGRAYVERLHFAGLLQSQDYLSALQISSVHVYLTYPFVVSWSLLEALSVGCVVIASDTAPVRDIVTSDNGLLVPFFEIEQLAESIIEVLANEQRFRPLRARARRSILERFDMRRKCLPEFMALLGRDMV
jgi:glycosyltransferase involved in cell wall biosynthesis